MGGYENDGFLVPQRAPVKEFHLESVACYCRIVRKRDGIGI